MRLGIHGISFLTGIVMGTMITIFLLSVFLPSFVAVIEPLHWKIAEPIEHRKIRAKIKVWSNDYGGAYLDWYPIRKSYGPDTDQMSVTYMLIFPGREKEGDIDAFCEIYNPPGTWMDRSFEEMIIEFTRFQWASLKIEVDGRVYNLPKVTSDDVFSLGYLTCTSQEEVKR